jgi:hypothetical protein
VSGDRAVRILSAILPAINRFGASPAQVRQAVAHLAAYPTPAEFVRGTASGVLARRRESGLWVPQVGPTLGLTATELLAMEMAVHEDQERRALEGELAALETAWREAEEIAGIADNLFLPEAVRTWLRQHR